MGKRDIRLKPYLSDDVRFADIVNASVFQGKQIILPQQLSVQDSVRATAIESHQNKKDIQRFGDVIKKAALGTKFIVVSLENQNDIHYAMPLRSFSFILRRKEVGRRYRFIWIDGHAILSKRNS